MCGRYAAAKDPAALAEEFEAVAPTESLAPDYNVAPTKKVYVVVDRPVEDTLTRTLEDHGVSYECEIHPETEHGFCFPKRPAYVADRAEIAWRKMSEMFDRRLKG